MVNKLLCSVIRLLVKFGGVLDYLFYVMYYYRKYNIYKVLVILERVKFMFNQLDMINLEYLIIRSCVEMKLWLKKFLLDVELKNFGFFDYFFK